MADTMYDNSLEVDFQHPMSLVFFGGMENQLSSAFLCLK